ncbi:MAG: hypothetical protein OEZ68_06385 [Gammaproteobacteria bacterium]|nr:hypothetical protein [Gammaproteobacteria bacterium]MDH5800418.1 hypothetical protein [Gammaproteobacteria bacterium]
MTQQTKLQFSVNQKILMSVILLSALTGVVINMMRHRGIDGSALLYVGIPTIIALVFATTSSAKSAVGSTLKAITFVILISGPLLQEGFICMLMAAPIFYVVGALAAWPFDHYRKKKAREEDASKLNVAVLPVLFLIMSMEGVTDMTTFNRYNVVERSEIIGRSVSDIKQTLASKRKVPSPDALFGKLFPRPDWVNAQGLSVGDKHWVDISYFKWVYWNEKRGSTYFEVTEHTPGSVEFKPYSDDGYMRSYLDWGKSTVFFEPVAHHRTKVTWRIEFTRKLDPIWYVQPLQRYSVGILAETLINTLR